MFFGGISEGGFELRKKAVLTEQEKEFCYYYAESGNAAEAAAAAGFTEPDKTGMALMLRKEINDEIGRLYEAKAKNCRQRARAGYERLAFGGVADAVSLIFGDDPSPEQLAGYDLFNVAEIKRPKDGAMEIRFFDRLKALEKLEAFDDGTGQGVSRFYDALARGIDEQTPADMEKR